MSTVGLGSFEISQFLTIRTESVATIALLLERMSTAHPCGVPLITHGKHFLRDTEPDDRKIGNIQNLHRSHTPECAFMLLVTVHLSESVFDDED